MKKIVLTTLLVSGVLTASELEYGTGTFNMEGGFLGLDKSINTDISTFTLLNRHSNLPSSDFFYGYDFTWYDSRTLKQAQHTYNDIASGTNEMVGLSSNTDMKIPAMEHRVKGLDANIRLGYDVIKKDEDNFLGLGLIVGLSMPWIDSSQDDSEIETEDYFEDSTTDIMTYKIGPSINFQKTLVSNKLSFYGIASIAYQTGYIESDSLDSKLNVDGTFQEYNVGLYYTPFTETYKWGWLSLSPRVYGTLGYKYSKWDVDEIAIDISGAKLSSDILDPLGSKFSMDSSVGYFGIGYSF
jgi:hypothetical protein